jgi:HAD superfamily 5'-nucleotidase-like hydrolase
MATVDELPRSIRSVLERTGHELQTPPGRRIFTNRDLVFDDVKVVGFDMDYTLARYRQGALDQLSVEATVEKLVDAGYPPLLRDAVHDPDFVVRGLVVDKQLGNLLKMDKHGYVGRAFHGKTKLTRPRRKSLYSAQRIAPDDPRYSYVDTLFALSEVSVYAEIVRLLDERPEQWKGTPPDYASAYDDVRRAIDEAHQDDSIKARIKADPARYIIDDPELAPTLHKLRSAGKKLFLLTNSYLPYSDVVLRYLLEGRLDAYDDWRVYFDWMVVGGRKPDFFECDEPFLELGPGGEVVGSPKAEPQKGKVYQGGNRPGLQRAMGVPPDVVLYVGDHIYGDIVKSKKSSGWRTALVVDDLEHDLAVRRDYEVAMREIRSMTGLRDRLAEQIQAERHLQRALATIEPGQVDDPTLTEAAAAEMLEAAVGSARARFDRLRRHMSEVGESVGARIREVDAAFNPYWGSVFAERYDASTFGSMLEDYACLYTSRVSNFLYVSPARYFRAPHGRMPHWHR